MYIKVFISRMEMSQKIHCWHQTLLKIMIFLINWQKKHILVTIFFGQPTKCNSELKMLKLHENHLKTKLMSRRCFLIFWIKAFKNFDKKMSKKSISGQKIIFWHFQVTVVKIKKNFDQKVPKNHFFVMFWSKLSKLRP